MKRNILFLAVLISFFIFVPTVSAVDSTDIVICDVNHKYVGNHANFNIEGYVENSGDWSSEDYWGTPDGYVKLKVVGKNFTKESNQYTSNGDFYFSMPVNSGKYSYSLKYVGNSMFGSSSYNSAYTIPKGNSTLSLNMKLGIKKLTLTTKLTDLKSKTPISGIIQTKLGTKTYLTKTNSQGIATFTIPASSGKQNLLVSFIGSNIYNGKNRALNFSISPNTIIISKNTTKFVKYVENDNYLYKKYAKITKNYLFSGLVKTSEKYSYTKINSLRTVNFGSGTSHQIVKTYPDGYLEVDKYSYINEIGIYDYINYDNRYLDYIKICYNNGKTKLITCTHYYSDYWIISSIGVSKIKFYFYC